jgi:three-Cys-motif partner protein
MAKNINSKAFDEATKLKLDIFRKCFRAWLPVFVHHKWVKHIYIYDFFAGSGTDTDNTSGSPLILLEEAKGIDAKNCSAVRSNGKKVTFLFNEMEPNKKAQPKFELLKQNVENHTNSCISENQCGRSCIYDRHCTNKDFKEGFNTSTGLQSILNDKTSAKFILLDQYGFSKVDEDVFLRLVNSPLTDFIFFISSSYINRFADHPNTKKYIDTEKLQFDPKAPKQCHKIIADYFESLVPQNVEYYINHFTIQKGTGYYGLIFGTNHTYGMEKFQTVCWEEDKKAGESNCNTQNDFGDNTLFGHLEPNKISQVKDRLKNDIRNGVITDNAQGLKSALKQRCLPNVFTEAVKELEKANAIRRVGAKSYSSVTIHKIKPDSKDYYKIEVL